MQFQLPQFIETEDKIVGPFTLKQFVYLVATSGTAVLMYFILTPFVWFLIAVPLIVLGVALAFIKVNGQPFTKIALSAAKFYWQPQTYVWQPEEPKLPKGAHLEEHVPKSPGISLENIVAGLALKSAWQEVQTGSKSSPAEVAKRSFAQMQEQYEVFRRITGERHAARRIDYR